MQDANLEDTNLQCIISIKKTIPYFGKKKNSFFFFSFFMQSFNFCQLLVQIFYLFQHIIQKRLFLWLEAATGGVLYKKVFLEILQNSQENTCGRVSF